MSCAGGIDTCTYHWKDTSTSGLSIDIQLQAAIGTTKAGKTLSSVYIAGTVTTKKEIKAGTISLLKDSSWWTTDGTNSGVCGSKGAWPSYWPIDPVLYCPMTSVSQAGLTAELAITQGHSGATSPPKEASFGVSVGGKETCGAGVEWHFSCSWLGGAGTAGFVTAAP